MGDSPDLDDRADDRRGTPDRPPRTDRGHPRPPTIRGVPSMSIERCWWSAILAVLASAPIAARADDGAGADPGAKVDFAHVIAPLLKAKCTNCHADGRYKGAFSLDTRES